MTAEQIIQNILEKSSDMTRPVFRGQAIADWPPESGAVRRLKKAYKENFPKDELKVKKMVDKYCKEQLIMPMQVIDGDDLDELKRLSTLQHYGAATSLLDFTDNLMVALLFACREHQDKDARIFILDIENSQFAINGRNLEKPFDEEETAVYYEPDRSLGSRIIAQQSVFIICNPFIPEDNLTSVSISQESKDEINRYLHKLGLSQKALFVDVPGLATINSTHSPLPLLIDLTPEEHRVFGNNAYQEGRFDDALDEYKSFQKSSPELLAQPHYLIGDVFATLEQYDKAISAYTKAIENLTRSANHSIQSTTEHSMDFLYDNTDKPVNAQNLIDRLNLSALYYNRGNLCAAISNHCRAVDDYNIALKKAHKHLIWRILYNRGNSYFALKKYDVAFQDFEKSWLYNESGNAALALGNCEIMAGEFERAYKYYLTGMIFESNKSTAPCHRNGDLTRKILKVLGNNQYKIIQQEDILHVEFEHIQDNPRHFGFTGNSGNNGNFSLVSDYGRKGYKGIAGFTVIIQQPSSPGSIKNI